jgi:protein TonB
VDFAQQQRNPGKHLVGISLVVLFHVIMIYALVTGLAQKIVAVAKHPLETKIIEEIKEKPPEEPPPPPPKLQLPPPPFIPPPEVQIQVPVNIAPTISTTTNVKPAAPSAVTRAPEAPKPAIRRGVKPTNRVLPVYPRKALKDQITGSVEAQLTVGPNGKVIKVAISKSTPPGVFDKAAIEAMSQYEFEPDGTQWIGIVEIDFKLED